jgi:hypothetical protein
MFERKFLVGLFDIVLSALLGQPKRLIIQFGHDN